VRQKGFTLLEVLVATVIMAVAVAGLLGSLSTSLRNASRLSDYDRAALLARRTMDGLLVQQRLPKGIVTQGAWDPAGTGLEGGWRARVTPFEQPPAAGPGSAVLERIELEVWWMSGGRRRTFALEGFRAAALESADFTGAEARP